jgi:hypothetical protein
MMKKPIARRKERSHLAVPTLLGQKLKAEAEARKLSVIAATAQAIELWISTAPSLEQASPLPNPPTGR